MQNSPNRIDATAGAPSASPPAASVITAIPPANSPDVADDLVRAKEAKQANLKAAAASEAKTRRIVEGGRAPILPDCCNIGIALRVFVAVNLAAALGALLTSVSIEASLSRLLDVFLLTEPVLILSLAGLCAARKFSNGAINGKSYGAQWFVGISIPVVAMLVWAGVLAAAVPDAVKVEQAQPDLFWFAVRALFAGCAAWAIIEFLRYRSLAFSPSVAEARLQALQARIRPHFLFNSLNTVLGLMRAEPRKAEKTLENLADLFRVFMRDTRELVPLEEEVYTCREYLAIEKLRLAPRLEAKWNTEEMPGDALLPSLLLQPLIENAVHHGIEPRTTPGLIEVTLRKAGERVHIEILNPIADYVPANSLPVRAGNQMALSNVRERLMLLYDMEAELKTSEEHGQFRLVLEFPYRKERRSRDVRRNFDPDC